MVQQSNPERANSSIAEYSPRPGTLRSNTLEVTDEPWTKNTTGREGSPAFGAPTRLRYIHNGISPFLAQYSLLQISPPSEAAALALCVGSALASPPTTKPRPAPLMTVRRASGRSNFSMISSNQTRPVFCGFYAAPQPARPCARTLNSFVECSSKSLRFAEATLRCRAQQMDTAETATGLLPAKRGLVFRPSNRGA